MAAVSSSDTAQAAELLEEIHISRRGVVPRQFPAFPAAPSHPAVFHALVRKGVIAGASAAEQPDRPA